jgi:hypothetical protein
MTPPAPPWKCTRRVGFLFPHDCQRLAPEGCPDCRNGTIDDPYRGGDRYGYDDYDDYDNSYYVGYGYPLIGIGGPGYDSSMEFTEADGADLVKPDEGFENDMQES